MIGIKVPGSFAPGTVDGFVTEARWIKGTYIVVNTLDEANAIPEGVRVDGTLIYDLETGFEYRWESDAWVIQAKSFADAPKDGKIYARQNGVWTIIDVDSIENSMETISDNLSKLEQEVNEGFQDVLEEVDTKLENYVPRSELSNYAQIELYTYPDAPTEPGDENTLYFIKTADNGYDFKIWWPSTNSFVTIGSTEVNLDNYYTKAQVDTKLSELEESIPDTSGFATKDELSNLVTEDELAVVESKIPDVSSFITKSVDDLVNYYLKSETYTKAEVDSIIESVTSISFEVVTELPTTGESNKIYLKLKEESANNSYEEYIWINEKWELIGSTEVDLSNYVTTDDFTSTLESYVKSEDLSNTLSEYITSEQLTTALSSKQDTLVSGTNIKTINSQSILGEGDIQIEGVPGKDGVDGTTFIPSVSSEGVISWTNDGDKENPLPQSIKGADGISPHVGDNENWFIGDTDTGKPSRGENGAPGAPGEDAPYALDIHKSTEDPKQTNYFVFREFSRKLALGEKFWCYFKNITTNIIYLCYFTVSKVIGALDFHADLIESYRITGTDGEGIPEDGTTGQFLQKTDDGTAWASIDLSSKADINGTYPDMTVGGAASATNAQRATTAQSATTAQWATNATNAANATKATQDANGNNIAETYATRTELTETAGTKVKVNGATQPEVNFTSDPQTQITANKNALAEAQSDISSIINGTTTVGKAARDATDKIIHSTYATKDELNSGLSGKANTSGTYPNLTVGKATNADNATNATNADKATSDVEGNAILSTYAKLTALNETNATLQEVQEKANEAEAIARGKATSYVFETVTALDDWLEAPENVAKLHVGDNFYIEDVGVPDYWWNGEARMVLESEKPDMSNYYSKDEIDTRLGQKANTDGTYSSMSVGFATSAQTAENATHATTADSATNATHATSADTATSATTAQSATTAESATNATNAVNATTATNAGHATTADSATKATQDGDGNVISTTYVKVNEIPSAEVTKQAIADALGCTTAQLDTIVALAQKISVDSSNITSTVRITAPEFNDN